MHLSVLSPAPLGRAMLGFRKGSEVENVPKGGEFEQSAKKLQLVVRDRTKAPCQILSLSPRLSVGYR